MFHWQASIFGDDTCTNIPWKFPLGVRENQSFILFFQGFVSKKKEIKDSGIQRAH
jgi:hypothetical protein